MMYEAEHCDQISKGEQAGAVENPTFAESVDLRALSIYGNIREHRWQHEHPRQQ